MIAAGGSLGIMIPPSTVFAVYGLITEQDIGKLFIAGIVPGILAVGMYIATINIIALVRPGFLPVTPRHSWAERLEALRDVWAVSLLFIFIIGGIYAGAVHRHRSRRHGRRRRLHHRGRCGRSCRAPISCAAWSNPCAPPPRSSRS